MNPSPLESDAAEARRFAAKRGGGSLRVDPDGAVCVYQYPSTIGGSFKFSTRWKNGVQTSVEYEEWETVPLLNSEQRAAPQPTKPVAAAANDNDNRPFSIFDWKASRFVGDPEPTEYLVSGVIEAGIPGMVAAMGEVGKSFALLELSRRVAFGSTGTFPPPPIFGGQVVQEGTAVFITGEDDAKSMHRRLTALDPRGARFAANGEKLIVVPMPSAVGAIKPYWREDKRLGPVETDEWKRLVEQLASISDLKLLTIDPLQLFGALPLNEDPAAAQFVCGSISTLSAHTKANIFVSHHMAKRAKDIVSLADARDAVRGSSALVDGVRLAYGLWYGDPDKAKKICREIGVSYEPNRIVHGGVIKANGDARRILSTYSRNDFGLLVDSTARLGAQLPAQGDMRVALVVAVEAAAAAGSPYTKTGVAGLYEMRERLPEELQLLSKSRLDALAEEALQRGEIVKTKAKGEKVAKWLDVPTGLFAMGLGEFRAGMPR